MEKRDVERLQRMAAEAAERAAANAAKKKKAEERISGVCVCVPGIVCLCVCVCMPAVQDGRLCCLRGVSPPFN
jgi:hypothetical protein